MTYSIVHQGEVLDYRYLPSHGPDQELMAYNFYIGEIFFGSNIQSQNRMVSSGVEQQHTIPTCAWVQNQTLCQRIYSHVHWLL
jgi:hypothetical protein